MFKRFKIFFNNFETFFSRDFFFLPQIGEDFWQPLEYLFKFKYEKEIKNAKT